MLMFVIRGTSKVDGPQRRDKSASISTGQDRLEKQVIKSRTSPFHLAHPSQRGSLLLKPGVQGMLVRLPGRG